MNETDSFGLADAVLPAGFHRIRCCGLLTNPTRQQHRRIRGLLAVPLIPIDAI
jgi:hypothetical protein